MNLLTKDSEGILCKTSVSPKTTMTLILFQVLKLSLHVSNQKKTVI